MRGETIDRFPIVTHEKVRYSDTDRQGHVNNVLFSAFLEAGRAELLFCSGVNLRPRGCEFVLARANIDFFGQLHWPGEVTIGTRIEQIGRSSIMLKQALFQQGRCAAVCESVMVLIRARSGTSTPIGAKARAFLESLRIPRPRQRD